MEGEDEVWLEIIQSRFDWGQSEGTHLKVSMDPNEHVRYMRLGSVPKPGEAGRFPRATYSAGDQIVVRYSEPGCLTRTSPATSPASQGENYEDLWAWIVRTWDLLRPKLRPKPGRPVCK